MLQDGLSTLFDLLPIGAYRSTPDGTIVRLNAALLRINGYANEAECLADAKVIGAESYVQPGRRQQFITLLEANGQVTDFVSETYRLKTGEHIWVREHAHLVRDAGGKTLYIEGTIEDITQERKASLSLQHSESLLRNVLETIPDRVWLKDVQGIHMACNAAYASHLGTTAERVTGTNDVYWFGEKLAALFGQTDLITIQAGKTLRFEGPMHSPMHDDATIYEVIKTPMIDAANRTIGVLGMARDIHDRKQAETLLRDTTEQLELALMGADLGRWDHDLSIEKGYYLDERSCAMLGRPASDTNKGRAWGHLIHPQDLPGTLDAMRAHLSGAVPAYEAEYRARHSGGHWIWMSNRGKVVQLDQHGRPLRMVGTLMNISKRKEVESELLKTQADLKNSLNSVAHLAFHDALTDLPNRRLLNDRLETALSVSQRQKKHGAVLFLDLDKFKLLNDNFGHDVGDLLLREVAARLLQCVREVDTVARLGGDEFVVLLQNLSVSADNARQHTATVAGKILASLNEAFLLQGTHHNITTSIGATVFLGHSVSATDVLKHADTAMYDAKAKGRNTLRFHEKIELQPSQTLRQ
ncbi:MAG: diguanylate cyclase [Rhodoferax sp.]|nr:diguanylate cyclase [Rhodoferax sp.]